MKLLQEKLAKYDAPQRAMAAGIYPYFREIQSDQDTEEWNGLLSGFVKSRWYVNILVCLTIFL